MTILIIGGTGVLSSAVVTEALKQGFKVTMINRGRRKKLIPNGVEVIVADKSDKKKIQSALKGRTFDAVMDYLCYSEKDTTESFNFYLQYTKQYFFISSCAVYNTSLGGTFREDSPKVLPIWDYSFNKWASEKHLMMLAADKDVKYTIIRPCVTYGDTRIPYGIAPQYGCHWTLIARIKNGKPLVRWNGGNNRCNMMRVEDFAVGVVGLIGNPLAYNEDFNICGDETPSFNEVLECLSELVGISPKLVDVESAFYAKELPEKAGEILGGRSIDAINSNEKIKRVVPAFRHTISLKEGMRMTYDAYARSDCQHGIDWKYEGETDGVIQNWCNRHHIDISGMNLHFIDYLDNADWKNKAIYYLSKYHKCYAIRFLLLVGKVGRKVIRKIV